VRDRGSGRWKAKGRWFESNWGSQAAEPDVCAGPGVGCQLAGFTGVPSSQVLFDHTFPVPPLSKEVTAP